MSLWNRYRTTLTEALGPHWVRLVLVWGGILYTVATNAESYLRGRGMTVLPTLYSSAFVAGVGVVWVCWHLISYANKLRETAQPRFKVSFDSDTKAGLQQTPIGNLELRASGPELPSTMATFVRVQIDATSNVTVRNCQAFITEIQKRTSKEKPAEIVKLPHSLALGAAQPFDVPPKIPKHVDFLRSDSVANRLGLMMESVPYPLFEAFRERGRYTFKIAVTGDGSTEEVRVEVIWRGAWDTIIAKQVE